MSDPDDERRLLDRLATGEPEAFAQLYELYGPRLYGTALGLLRNPDAAEDAVQDLFVALVRSRSALRSVESLPAYLFSSLFRRVHRNPSGLRITPASEFEDATDPRPGPPLLASRKEDRQRLAAAIQLLPESQQEVLTLKVDGELTFTEIGAVLGISPNTAASRYRYALERLRELLAEARPTMMEPRNDA